MSRSGYVYILTNPCFNAYFKSKIVKIGQAKDVQNLWGQAPIGFVLSA